MRHRRRLNPETHEELERRIREQFPALFITLVSVLVGLALADLIGEARSRLILWPLTPDTLRTWGEFSGNLFVGLGLWIWYAHIGISRRGIPSLADSLIAFTLPLCLLVGNSFVGLDAMWPWLYWAAAFMTLSLLTNIWNFRVLRHETELASFHRLGRLSGYSSAFLLGAPSYAALGWADQHHLLPPLAQTLLALTGTPVALLVAHVFLRDWQRAVRAPHDPDEPD
jgi:hypothetical protein